MVTVTYDQRAAEVEQRLTEGMYEALDNAVPIATPRNIVMETLNACLPGRTKRAMSQYAEARGRRMAEDWSLEEQLTARIMDELHDAPIQDDDAYEVWYATGEEFDAIAGAARGLGLRGDLDDVGILRLVQELARDGIPDNAPIIDTVAHLSKPGECIDDAYKAQVKQAYRGSLPGLLERAEDEEIDVLKELQDMMWDQLAEQNRPKLRDIIISSVVDVVRSPGTEEDYQATWDRVATAYETILEKMREAPEEYLDKMQWYDLGWSAVKGLGRGIRFLWDGVVTENLPLSLKERIYARRGWTSPETCPPQAAMTSRCLTNSAVNSVGYTWLLEHYMGNHWVWNMAPEKWMMVGGAWLVLGLADLFVRIPMILKRGYRQPEIMPGNPVLELIKYCTWDKARAVMARSREERMAEFADEQRAKQDEAGLLE